jgi:ribosome-binding factor A
VPRDFSRGLRVGAELQRVINELLQLETKDPRLKEARISEVEVSGDLGVATVYFGLLRPEDDSEPAIKAFASASGFIRRRIGQEIRLRRVPELRFIHDASARQGLEISQLIDAAARPERNGES